MARSSTLLNKLSSSFNAAANIYMKSYEDEFISMEHLILSAIDIDTTTAQFVGNKKEVITEIIKKIRGGNHVTSQNPEVNYEALEKYGRFFIADKLCCRCIYVYC